MVEYPRTEYWERAQIREKKRIKHLVEKGKFDRTIKNLCAMCGGPVRTVDAYFSRTLYCSTTCASRALDLREDPPYKAQSNAIRQAALDERRRGRTVESHDPTKGESHGTRRVGH